KEPLDALVQLGCDTPAAADHLGEIPARLAAKAKLSTVVLEQLRQVSVGQEGLGRNASPVQANAAELVALDTEHPFLELGGTDCAGISRGAAADYHDVVIVGHRVLL